MFLRIKQGLLLEVDMQSGQERCRLELDSLAGVETAEAAWTRGVSIYKLYNEEKHKKKLIDKYTKRWSRIAL